MGQEVKVSVGADPEAFLFNTELNRIVPACGLIGGTKDKPLWYSKNLTKGFTVQEDNVLVEFNIPPAFSLDAWCEYMQTAVNSVAQYVATKGPYVLKFVSEHKFANKDMQSDQSQMFGCSPDFDAYNSGAQFDPIKPDVLKIGSGQHRVAGGHVHVGFESAVPSWVAAGFADYFIGLPSVGYDKQALRRNLYGQPGRHRVTSYGIEYRTLSNYWLADGGLVASIGSAAFTLGQFLSKSPVSTIQAAYQKLPWGAIRQAITEQDSQLRQQIAQYVEDEGIMKVHY
jgi:hypothetical protein